MTILVFARVFLASVLRMRSLEWARYQHTLGVTTNDPE